jgi:hypothetical protein
MPTRVHRQKKAFASNLFVNERPMGRSERTAEPKKDAFQGSLWKTHYAGKTSY